MESHQLQESADYAPPMRASLSRGQANTGALDREVRQLNVPWEQLYGYAQAVRVGKFIYGMIAMLP